MEISLLKGMKLGTCAEIIFHRTFNTSCYLNGKRQVIRAMKKVMGGRKKKFYYNESATLPSPSDFSKGSLEGKGSGNSRRASVLNKIFMRYVTDIMATGERSSEILGHGIEINKVQITPDYKILKVYWIARGTKNDEVVEDILQRNAYPLRHELSQLRIVGNVPIVQFVKDKTYAQVVEVDSRLHIADFGEDHIHVEASFKLKSELELFTSLDSSDKSKIEELEQCCEDMDEAPIPPMVQNVLGLNHADILNRIMKATKKSDAVHRQSDASEDNWAKFKVSQPINEDPVVYASHNAQRADFREFVRKRQILKEKARKSERDYRPDLDCLKEEQEQENIAGGDIEIFSRFYDEDFVEEYDSEKKI